MSAESKTDGIGSRLLRGVVILLVLALGGGIAAWLVKTAPRAPRRAPERQARLVEVQPVRVTTQRAVIGAMGTVQPAREVALQPRVSGQVIEVAPAFAPGGLFREGEMLLRIDPTDFELAVRQRESDVAEARSALALEEGQQAVARREFELLGEKLGEAEAALMLRQPQLAQARARLATAQAALDLAKLNRERTVVVAPFAAQVRSRHVNVGAHVTPATVLAQLTGTAEYWVEAALPVDELQWLAVPGAAARVFNEAAWGAGVARTGVVTRLLGDLEPAGRMARLLITVAEPVAAGQPPLLLESFVRVEVAGREVAEVAAVDRRWVRDGDSVWLFGADGKLEIRPVAVVFRGREQLLVRGLRAGEQLVTTDLAAAVAGMPLRTAEARGEK